MLAALAAASIFAIQPALAERVAGGARTVYGAPNAAICATAANQGRATDEAIAACDLAIAEEQLGPGELINTYNNRGAIRLARREAALALADFDRVLRANPENAQAMVNRGAALVMSGQPGPAVAALTRALALGVSSPHIAYFNRGNAREILGDLRGALEDYSTALAIQPEWGPAEAELARFAAARRDRLASAVASQEAGNQ